MKTGEIAFLAAFLAPFAAFAVNEGVPSYYQTTPNVSANRAAYGQYSNMGYTQYVGQSGQKQIVGTSSYTYQVPRQKNPVLDNTSAVLSNGTYIGAANGTITANGMAMPLESEPATTAHASYSRRFADFQFKTGVNSILEWDDMIFNEVNVGIQHNFALRNFDLFAYADYSYGEMTSGGLSMDYDLEPYDWADERYGIFTISMGDQAGRTNHLRLGIGARHIWDIGGWKLSPSIGYEVFKHNLKMSNHLYPNPGIYLPLMAVSGDYVYGDEQGYYYTLPTDVAPQADWYQVCMAPEDIKLVDSGSSYAVLGESFTMTEYTNNMEDRPWGVYGGECIIIGGDGPILVDGTTHIYNTTWSGFYVGLEIEKQMTLADKLRFYVQFGLPKYSAEGIWPNREDWQQNPSFLDEGDNGAYSYMAEMEYNLKLSNRLQLALKVDTNYFHVGKIGGELYVASYGQYLIDEETGQYIVDQNGNPIYETVAAHTEPITESLKEASWQSFGIHLGVKYAF